MREKLFIAKPDWFSRRKYSWWGLWVKTWQWWSYVLIMIGILILSFKFAEITDMYSLYFWMTVFFFFILDTFYVMYVLYHSKIDERERLHEAIAERNALWWTIAVLAVGVLYQASLTSVTWKFEIDPIIIIALLFGLSIKAITNYKLERNN